MHVLSVYSIVLTYRFSCHTVTQIDRWHCTKRKKNLSHRFSSAYFIKYCHSMKHGECDYPLFDMTKKAAARIEYVCIGN